MSFWSELKRRNVVRVGGVYAVVGWLLVQVAVALESAMSLPSWFDGMVVAVLLLGFPVALIITWAFELTPEGIKPSAPAPEGVLAPSLSAVDGGFLVAMLAVLAISVFQITRPAPTTAAAAPEASVETEPASGGGPSEASIAVLPFLNLSSDPEQEYFSDGLSDQLMNQLAQIEGLRVAGRTSSFAFKGQNPNFREIGEALGVATVLEGSVQKSNDRIRVIAQLVSAEDGFHLWSETYNRDLDDIFAIQDEIAMAVADALSVTLGLGAQAPDYGGATSVEAYDHYLRGVTSMAQGNEDAMRRAAEEFRQAVAVDPDFARAWIGLAEALSNLRNMVLAEAPQIEPERAAAVERALALAPDLPSAQMVKGWLHVDRREWLDAYRACERVFAGPPDVEAVGICGGLLTEVGAVRAGLPYREAWVRADPLSWGASLTLARQYLLLGRKDAFLRELERAQDLPNVRIGHGVYRLLQMLGEGAPRDDILAQLDYLCPVWRSYLDCAPYRAAVETPAEAAPQLRAGLEELRANAPGDAILLAWFAAYAGEDELALEAIEVFEPFGSGANYQTIWAPLFADVRRLPRFKTFVDEGGLLEVWRETDDWGDYCRPLGPNDFECR